MAKKRLIEMEVKGFDELRKNIKALKLDFDKELKKAIRRFGKTVLNDGKKNYETKFTMRTGKGLESFKLSVKEKDGEIFATIVAGGGEAYYVPMQELGTSKFEARPFLRPAVDENRDKIVDGVKIELQKAIKRAEKRVKK